MPLDPTATAATSPARSPSCSTRARTSGAVTSPTGLPRRRSPVDSRREVAAAERTNGPADANVSCNRTCEMGMTAATGHLYRHVLEVVEEVTR